MAALSGKRMVVYLYGRGLRLRDTAVEEPEVSTS